MITGARQITYEAQRMSPQQISRTGKNRTRNLRMPFVHDNYSVALKVVADMKLKKRLYKFIWTIRQNGMPVLCDIFALNHWTTPSSARRVYKHPITGSVNSCTAWCCPVIETSSF
jgi:hypothetical protein